MWLIDTTTLQLEEIVNPERHSYAILSHRWRKDELTFKDVKKGRGQQKQGYRKLEALCHIALEHKLQYAWMDTCCINKDSSAELSEAINSMYRWYADSSLCIVYLDDVTVKPEDSLDLWGLRDKENFCASEWWTRGWTLQELLAPSELNFYNDHWQLLGNRRTLRQVVARASNIRRYVLEMFDRSRKSLLSSPPSHHFPIAQRMSWAADRKTTRIEDQAYSLMGLFNVNMVPVYGEGSKAFVRLQQEVVRNSNDQSIFAWSSPEPGLHGLLAPDISCFKYSSSIVQTGPRPGEKRQGTTEPYQFVNGALFINLPIVPTSEISELYYAYLRCSHSTFSIQGCKLVLVRLDSADPPTFARMVSSEIHEITWMIERQQSECAEGESSTEEIVFMDALQRVRIPEPSLLPTASDRKRWGIHDRGANKTIVNPNAIRTEDGLELEPGVSGLLAFAHDLQLSRSSWRWFCFMTGLDSNLNPTVMVFDNRAWPYPISKEDFAGRFGLIENDKGQEWRHRGFWPPNDWARILAPMPILDGALFYGPYLIMNECRDPSESWWRITLLPEVRRRRDRPGPELPPALSSTEYRSRATLEDSAPAPARQPPRSHNILGTLAHQAGAEVESGYWTIDLVELNIEVALRPSTGSRLCDLWCGGAADCAAPIRVCSDWIKDGPDRYYRKLRVV